MTQTSDPVFVDTTGRRRRLARRTGFVAGLLIAGFLVIIGTGLFAGADMPLSPWPGDGGPGAANEAGSGHERTAGTRPAPKPVGTASHVTPPSARPGQVTRTAPVTPTAARDTTPATALTHPGNSQATPRAVGRTRSPNKKRP